MSNQTIISTTLGGLEDQNHYPEAGNNDEFYAFISCVYFWFLIGHKESRMLNNHPSEEGFPHARFHVFSFCFSMVITCPDPNRGSLSRSESGESCLNYNHPTVRCLRHACLR